MDDIKAFKEDIKSTKLMLKKLEKELVIKPNSADKYLVQIYTRHLQDSEVALRGLKLRARVEKAGLDYDEWWEWAKSLYSIHHYVSNNQFMVTSKARNWKDDTDASWFFADEISCKEKIEQLVGYKLFDRNRGRGDFDADLK